MRLPDFLNDKNVQYDVIQHRETYDAQRMAQTLHVSGREVAKTVLLRSEDGADYYVAVLPADKSIDFDQFPKTSIGKHLELATELEISKKCPDCEMGALPPFGSAYGMKTVVDESLTEDESIVFEGNTHDESIRMQLRDFMAIEDPLVASFTG